MNARRSQLRWPAAALAAITLLGLTLALNLVHQERNGSELGRMTRREAAHTPLSPKGNATVTPLPSRESYKVDLLPAGALRKIKHDPDADGNGVDTVHRAPTVHGFGPSRIAVGITHAAAKLPPVAVRRWLLQPPRPQSAP